MLFEDSSLHLKYIHSNLKIKHPFFKSSAGSLMGAIDTWWDKTNKKSLEK